MNDRHQTLAPESSWSCGEHHLAGLCGPCVGLFHLQHQTPSIRVREPPSLGPPGSTEGSPQFPFAQSSLPKGPCAPRKAQATLLPRGSPGSPHATPLREKVLRLQQQTLSTVPGERHRLRQGQAAWFPGTVPGKHRSETNKPSCLEGAHVPRGKFLCDDRGFSAEPSEKAGGLSHL